MTKNDTLSKAKELIKMYGSDIEAAQAISMRLPNTEWKPWFMNQVFIDGACYEVVELIDGRMELELVEEC